jgi:thymidylate synthase (FAD)
MTVKLIAISKPTIDECSTAEELVAYCARVSNPANQNNHDTSDRLIRYLINNAHWSPLEMVHMTMEINTTRDIARQILRHRSFSFQEFSQRYADPTKDLGFSTREARLQDHKNRQNSIEIDDERTVIDPITMQAVSLKDAWEQEQQNLIRKAQSLYKWAIDNGIAKEQARAVLPEGLTDSKLYMSGSLRSWVHYCDLRRANGTQKEHQLLAEECWKIVLGQFPMLKDNQ